MTDYGCGEESVEMMADGWVEEGEIREPEVEVE
jgi:hypothetical protein